MRRDREERLRDHLRPLKFLLRGVAGLLVVAAALGSTIIADLPAPTNTCVCATARETNAWCSIHGIGYVGGVKLLSDIVYEAIDAHGHDVDLSKFPCPTCRAAISTDGFCDLHRRGFVHKKAYFSGLTYELGRAELRPASSIACSTCRKNAKTHGWCAKSGVGMVGPFAITDRKSFDRAVAGLALLVAAEAEAPRCKHCAVAILFDAECPVCKISFRGGKALKTASAPSAAGTSR